ncbi:hypothetical protein ABOONEI_2714 [Aciduliprofundum boonei T469]|nr:hypothetical protein ABOONEI_2714 [Aciduliprofundum boonei T469]
MLAETAHAFCIIIGVINFRFLSGYFTLFENFKYYSFIFNMGQEPEGGHGKRIPAALNFKGKGMERETAGVPS